MEAQLTERASPLVDALLAHSGRCCLCGDPTAHPDRSLCLECERDLEEKGNDYRAEQEQARRPF